MTRDTLGHTFCGSGRDLTSAQVEYHGVQADHALANMLTNLSHFDAVCSVCRTPGRSWSLMVSGRSDCPASFHVDYAGYLMAETHAAKRSEHICVHEQAEGVQGSGADEPAGTSGTLYSTETAGGLKNYKDNNEVTCAQCSSNAGPTYVRWGRSSCPASATLLYAGRAAGSHHAHAGGGHNYVCLHETPSVGVNDTAVSTLGARLYKTRYETSNKGLWSMWHLQVCRVYLRVYLLLTRHACLFALGFAHAPRRLIQLAPAGQGRALRGVPLHWRGRDADAAGQQQVPGRLEHGVHGLRALVPEQRAEERVRLRRRRLGGGSRQR